SRTTDKKIVRNPAKSAKAGSLTYCTNHGASLPYPHAASRNPRTAPARQMISKKKPWAAASNAENSMITRMIQSSAFMPVSGSTRGQFAPCQHPVRLDVLLTGLVRYILRQSGRGRLLVPLDCFQIVANKLLVVRFLRPPRLVPVRRPEARRIGCQYFIRQNKALLCLPEFKFGIGDDDAAARGIVRRLLIDRQGQVAQLLRQLPARPPGHFRKGNVLIVTAQRLRGRREDRLGQLVRFPEAGGQLDGAHCPALLVFPPPPYRKISPPHPLG